jgi:hypothetical protein
MISDYLVERLKIFHGTLQQALDAANQDEDLSVVSHIDAWKGDPSLKSTISFRVTFGDGTIVWLPTTSIEQTIPYQAFLEFHPILRHLLRTTAKASSEWIRSKRVMPITTVKVSDTDYGFKWYDEDLTLLPDRFDKKYFVEYEVLTVNKKSSRLIAMPLRDLERFLMYALS